MKPLIILFVLISTIVEFTIGDWVNLIVTDTCESNASIITVLGVQSNTCLNNGYYKYVCDYQKNQVIQYNYQENTQCLYPTSNTTYQMNQCYDYYQFNCSKTEISNVQNSITIKTFKTYEKCTNNTPPAEYRIYPLNQCSYADILNSIDNLYQFSCNSSSATQQYYRVPSPTSSGTPSSSGFSGDTQLLGYSGGSSGYSGSATSSAGSGSGSASSSSGSGTGSGSASSQNHIIQPNCLKNNYKSTTYYPVNECSGETSFSTGYFVTCN